MVAPEPDQPVPVPPRSQASNTVRADLQGWLLPAAVNRLSLSSSASVPSTMSSVPVMPAPIPAPLMPTPVPAPVIPAPVPAPVIPAPVPPPQPMIASVPTAPVMDLDESSDSDESTNQGRQLYDPQYPTPSIAYFNPIALNPQGPNIAHVPNKVQRKIQAGSYVDLGKLYRPDTPHAEEQIVAIKSNGMLKISSQPKSSDIYNFNRFLDCYLVYMAIRGKSHPNEYPSMCKYIEIVKGLFSQGYDGVYYDKRFRMMRADNHMIPWSCYMAELLVRKASASDTSFPNKSSSNMTNTSPAANNGSRKPCHYFNIGKCTRGNNCRFLHVCSICNDKSHAKTQHKK